MTIMLTALGRAAAQRLIRNGVNLAPIRTWTPRFKAPVRSFTTTRVIRSPETPKKSSTMASKTKAKGATKAKKPKTKAKVKKTPKKAAPKKKKKVKKVLEPEEKLRLEIRELKKVAMLKEPKKLPYTAWTVYVAQNVSSGTVDFTSTFQRLGREFKEMSASEIQRLQDTADKNQLSNAAAYKAWVESHDPITIHEANAARASLRRKVPKRSSMSRSAIRDERQPKRPRNAFALFVESRWASGEYSGDSTVALKDILSRYKALNAQEKQTWVDLAAADQDRYAQQMQSVLNKTVQSRS